MPARPTLPRLPRDAWLILAGDALSAAGTGLTLPFLLVYLARVRGIDLAVAGVAVSTVAIAGFVGNPVGGWLADRVGTKRTLAAGLSVAALGALLVVQVREPVLAFVAAATIGFGAAVISPVQDALLAVAVERSQRSTVFAVRNLTLNAGYAFGAVVASLLADLASPSSFETLYVIDGLTFLLFIPVLAVVRLRPGAVAEPVAPGPTAASSAGYAAVLRDRTFVRVWLLIAFLVTIGFAQTLSGFPAYATLVGGISASALSIAFALNTLTVVVAQFPVLRFLEGRRRTTGVVLACACWGAAWSLALIAGSAGLGDRAGIAFALAMMVFAVGEAYLAPSQAALINDLAPDDLRGRYNGLYAMAWTTGLAIGPAVAGVALDAGRGDVLLAGLVAGCGIAAIAARRLARHLPAAVDLVTLGREAAPAASPQGPS